MPKKKLSKAAKIAKAEAALAAKAAKEKAELDKALEPHQTDTLKKQLADKIKADMVRIAAKRKELEAMSSTDARRAAFEAQLIADEKDLARVMAANQSPKKVKSAAAAEESDDE